MRLIIVPLTVRQSLLYCQKAGGLPLATKRPRLDDRLAVRANKLWSEWQSSEVKWKKGLVAWTNRVLERISYDEWSLKSIPAQSSFKRHEVEKQVIEDRKDSQGNEILVEGVSVQVIPVTYVPAIQSIAQVKSKMDYLVNRSNTHDKKYFWLSLLGSPLTLPVALLPVLPNIPGFYLLFRAWSHWKAMEGGAHLQYLMTNNAIKFETNKVLNEFYKLRHKEAEGDDPLLLEHDGHIAEVASILEAEELEDEIRRAVHQIRHAREAEAKAEAKRAN